MEAYDAFLREKGAVDFADMINLAAENVTAGQKVHPYRYVIIDEYQDISYARYRLVKAILDQTGQIFFAWEMTGSLSTGLREVIFRSLQILNAISDAA